MENNKKKLLQDAGFDVSKCFSLVLTEDLKAGTKIHIMMEQNDDVIAKKIVNNGYLRNPRLQRRWIMAQTFRMLNDPNGYTSALHRSYNMKYQFEMMIHELKVLMKLKQEDPEYFEERRKFFTPNVIGNICFEYIDKLKKYIDQLPLKKFKHKYDYKIIPGAIYTNWKTRCGNCVFVEDIEHTILSMKRMSATICYIDQENIATLHDLLCIFYHNYFINIDATKCASWIDAFKKEGAFYTMVNMVTSHNCFLKIGHKYYHDMAAVDYLRDMIEVYEGWQMLGMLKEMIQYNHFDFNRRMRDIYMTNI